MKNSLQNNDSRSVENFMKKLKEFKENGIMTDEEKKDVMP